MNLLEHYIVEIHKETPTQFDDFKDVEFITVDITTNCYGHIKRSTTVFRKVYWEEAEENGYYMV